MSALAGVCGIPPPTTTVDGWLPHSSVTPVDEDSDISITFWERFYTNEFYYGIQQTVSLIDSAGISSSNLIFFQQWEIYQWERGINLMGARYRTAGDRELARIFTSDTSAQDERVLFLFFTWMILDGRTTFIKFCRINQGLADYLNQGLAEYLNHRIDLVKDESLLLLLLQAPLKLSLWYVWFYLIVQPN